MKFDIKKATKCILNTKFILSFVLLFISHFTVFAQKIEVIPTATNVYTNTLFIGLLSIIIILLIVIMVFAYIIKIEVFNKKHNENNTKSTNSVLKAVLILVSFGLFSNILMAQTDVVPIVEKANNDFWKLDGFVFYLMISIIFIETIIILFLYNLNKQLFGIQSNNVNANLAQKQPTILEKINASVSIENEAEIMLDHNYDGIRELDNNLPPWWIWGFYATIVFAVVYMVHFHVTKTGDLQLVEYQAEITKGKLDLENYKKNAANLIDENNVKVLTDETSLSTGKTIFMDNCAACHGRAGEGTVGPNLTDDYWLHEGGVKAIFKSIKYGWPEKGMKSWQQDLGAKQINEVASFIISLHGTNPPNAKEKQGELYQE